MGCPSTPPIKLLLGMFLLHVSSSMIVLHVRYVAPPVMVLLFNVLAPPKLYAWSFFSCDEPTPRACITSFSFKKDFCLVIGWKKSILESCSSMELLLRDDLSKDEWVTHQRFHRAHSQITFRISMMTLSSQQHVLFAGVFKRLSDSTCFLLHTCVTFFFGLVVMVLACLGTQVRLQSRAICPMLWQLRTPSCS